MAKASHTAHRLITASAADLFAGSTPKERTVLDVCRTPFAFGLAALVPIVLIVGALIFLVHMRPTFTELLHIPNGQGQAR
jgi:hypothetical protein